MLKIISKISAMLACLFLLAMPVQASEPQGHCEGTGYKPSLGTDFAAWAMQGSSLIYSSVAGNCRFTLEAWQFEFPKAVIELNSKNKGKGWKRKIKRGYSAYIDTFYNPATDLGWYSGLVFSTFKSEVSREQFNETSTFRSYEILLRFGYKYNLTENLSLEPWFAAGPIWADGSVNSIGGENFSESKIQALSTVHLNYQFNISGL